MKYIWDRRQTKKRGTINSDGCLNIRDNFILPNVCQSDNYEELLFMEDGSPSYLTLPVNALNEISFFGRWMGRRGPW
jgi:hypothetical protein